MLCLGQMLREARALSRAAPSAQSAATKTTPLTACQHKSHVPKTMFLAALGRPCDGFDGKVGIWRVVSERPAKNNKYVGPNAGRKKGDMIEEDCKLDGPKYIEMMTTKVYSGQRSRMSSG